LQAETSQLVAAAQATLLSFGAQYKGKRRSGEEEAIEREARDRA